MSHDFLGCAAGIDLGIVEEIDAGIACRRKALARRALVHLVAVRDP